MSDAFGEFRDRQERQARNKSSLLNNLLDNIYRCADKSTWYDSVASAYDRTRPRYPAEILARMQEIANLQGKSVLEIGAGVGIATVELARLGAKIVCLEPSQAACTIARDKCAAYGNVEVINNTFEEWELGKQKFDVVVAATSFHWITPEARYAKTAAALNDNGLLVLLWNTPPQPSYEIYQSCQAIYQTHAPELGKYESHQDYQRNIGKIAQKTIASGYFQDLITHQAVMTVTYTVDDYLTLLSTLSPYIKLASTQRQALFSELKTELKRSLNRQNLLELSYLSLLQIAHKH
ncbi:SAM-dependent methyltransferase [Pleurocapsa sp. CCALA 161]|uniref:class I SAM-dependent methyltransferase n=1 Tax=Pleurocapsa sp. CCALA 161 TaxID=2107688 RepID=UPI000D04A294|nr:class I SAM-dependent methyltransferase [Pleurocapsa sp. CCALA 161]PSB12312.1 SAM-dependent methyltransferase [Pleurocapsa sp. CCALA 161]